MSADSELAVRCLRGDTIAIRELVARFETDVFGLCVRLLRNRHDAEDVSQEVFLRVFRSLHRWDPNRPLRPWIAGITVNRCRTWMSRRRITPESADYLADLPGKDPPEPPGELTLAIREVLATLRDEYRDVFVLFHETGRSYEEIAETIGRPVGTVKTWLHRARSALLEKLRERGLVLPETPAPKE